MVSDSWTELVVLGSIKGGNPSYATSIIISNDDYQKLDHAGIIAYIRRHAGDFDKIKQVTAYYVSREQFTSWGVDSD